MAQKNYAQYLVRKFQGNIEFAIKVVKSSLMCHLNDTERFESDLEVYEYLIELKTAQNGK